MMVLSQYYQNQKNITRLCGKKSKCQMNSWKYKKIFIFLPIELHFYRNHLVRILRLGSVTRVIKDYTILDNNHKEAGG